MSFRNVAQMLASAPHAAIWPSDAGLLTLRSPVSDGLAAMEVIPQALAIPAVASDTSTLTATLIRHGAAAQVALDAIWQGWRFWPSKTGTAVAGDGLQHCQGRVVDLWAQRSTIQ